MNRALFGAASTALLLCVVFSLAAPARARLPEEGLQRAKMAESHLRDNQTTEALELLEKLAADYPDEAAVPLRIAQIYDTLNEAGAALFNYRKYASLAGENIRDEALLRLQTLELMKSARDSADEIATRRREAPARVAVPTPVVSMKAELVNPDGTAVEITTETVNELFPTDENAQLQFPTADTAIARATPRGTAHPDPAVSVRTDAQPPAPGTKTMNARPRPVDAEPVPTATYSVRTGGGISPGMLNAGKSATSAPDAPVSTVRPDAGPSQPGRVPQSTPVMDDIPPPTPVSATKTAQVAPGRGLQVSVSSRTSAPHTPSAGRTPFPGLPLAVSTPNPALPASPAPRLGSTDDAALGRNVFRAAPGRGSECNLVLANEHELALVTIAAKSSSGTGSINVILSPNERREIPVEPGTYSVVITVTTTTYPATPTKDKRFDFEFRAGTDYLAAFNDQTFI